MKMNLAAPLAAFGIFASSFWLGAQAQVAGFTYQGRLNDQGNPAQGMYDLQFAVYDSTNSPGIIVAGPVTNSATMVRNGLFSVDLDFGSGVFNGADRWLEIGVRPTGSANDFIKLDQRQRIGPAVYALSALAVKGSRNFGAASGSFVAAWDSATSAWYTTNTGAGVIKVVQSEGNFCGINSNRVASAWSKVTKSWSSVQLVGTTIEVVGSSGNFCVINSASAAAAWNQDTGSWTTYNLPGGGATVIGSGGNFCVKNDAAFAVAWSQTTRTWNSINRSGTVNNVTGSNGNFAITSSTGEVAAWNQDTGEWNVTNLPGLNVTVTGSDSL
jgi:hypothetical protein